MHLSGAVESIFHTAQSIRVLAASPVFDSYALSALALTVLLRSRTVPRSAFRAGGSLSHGELQ